MVEPQTEQTSRSAQLISADNTAGSAELLILPQEAHTRVWTHVHTSTQSGSFKRLNGKNSKTWQHIAKPVVEMLC